MKKILLTISLATVTLFSFAQKPTFGIKGGVNFASINASSDATNASLNSGNITSFNASFFLDFKLGHFSIQPAVAFTGKGGNFTENVTTADETGSNPQQATVGAKETLYYLQVPVNIVYHVPVVVGEVYFGAGPYVAQGISGRAKVTGVDLDGDGSPDKVSTSVNFGNDQGDIKQTQLGVNAIVGFKFKSGFLINANYDLGLTNDDPYKADTEAKTKSRVFGLSIGYVFL